MSGLQLEFDSWEMVLKHQRGNDRAGRPARAATSCLMAVMAFVFDH